MAKLKLRGKDLKKINFPDKKTMALAMNVMLRHYRKLDKATALQLLYELVAQPQDYLTHEVFGQLAQLLVQPTTEQRKEQVLSERLVPWQSFGSQFIESQAQEQMEWACRLPIAVQAALMPDAHLGYGLPIGGVLATDNAVIPYGVGVDIGCRMSLSVYPLPASTIGKDHYRLKEILMKNSKFGRDVFRQPIDHEVLDRATFQAIPFVQRLKDKAYRQLGSSGSGNHFVEWGIVKVTDPALELAAGEYLALLSHSGSRGMGAAIANHYTQIAMDTCLLPKQVKHLAWLDLASAEGEEYWQAMNLAGDYASACHDQIHQRMSTALGEKAVLKIENHHNFAWKETLSSGQKVIVHRKGATPAGKGVLGIIPGSMTAPGFIVRGKGNDQALASAAHGAGRKMSRTKARNSTTNAALKAQLKKQQVTLIGGGRDEAPMAYKDIHDVMKSQQSLVDVLGMFYPKIVRMDKA